MVDFAMTDWIVVLVVLVALGVLVHLLIAPFLQRRLMRCPKNGAITFVDVAPAPSGRSKPSHRSQCATVICGLDKKIAIKVVLNATVSPRAASASTCMR